jgi:hypothetical protein
MPAVPGWTGASTRFAMGCPREGRKGLVLIGGRCRGRLELSKVMRVGVKQRRLGSHRVVRRNTRYESGWHLPSPSRAESHRQFHKIADSGSVLLRSGNRDYHSTGGNGSSKVGLTGLGIHPAKMLNNGPIEFVQEIT